ncbi:hypothetical protein [Halopseudomonas pelagia]|uniref:hypothetical protein n=1 Tax=Halopseudomonas pelagia TaxID=553151 RepID=UPI0030D768EB|tara:strand:+ start:262 stop:1032 length:771 start_codon:yes stop_codon:yes gene_type:complete
MRRTGWKKTQDLSVHMDWKHANEPALMTWTVKAIDRSVEFWTAAFVPLFMIPLIGFIVTLFSGFSFLSWSAIFCFSFVLFLYVKVGLEKTVFVYRATSEHLEICQWQDIPDMVFTFLRVFPFVIVGLILMLFISDPGLSIAALAGPALLGILVASFGADPNYKAIHKKFRQHDYRWCDVDRAMFDSRKNLLALSVSGPNDVIQDDEIDFNNPADHRYLMRVFFRKDQEEAVLDLFKNKMPSKATTVSGNYKYLFCG